MDPVSHIILGLAVSKLAVPVTGGGGLATATVLIGSVMPDADIVLQKWGDYVYLKNHRGASHSLIGIAAESFAVGALLSATGISFLNAFLCCFIGGLGHMFFDILNSYGAEILWPLKKKKYSFSLIPIFDPFMLLFFGGYVFAPAKLQKYLLAAGMIYIAMRVLMRIMVKKRLIRKFRRQCGRIFILPSTTKLFKWHFIIEDNKRSIVGEANVLFRKVHIFKELEKIEDALAEKAVMTRVGKFFQKFTPIYHVTCRKIENGATEFTLTDMRYYLGNNFMHHATALLDKEFKPLKEFFQPYNINRKIEM